MSEYFLFEDQEINPDEQPIYLSDEISGKMELLDELYEKLSFPGYFGRNWDALEECLNDLSWLQSPAIVLVHPRLPCLPQLELVTYLEVLKSAARSWLVEGKPRLRVKFLSDRDKVQQLLA